VDTSKSASAKNVIGFLREHKTTLTWDQAAGTLRADTTQAITAVTGKAS
jgi:hypothetical protein